jgi:excisionase family DNA binding protein
MDAPSPLPRLLTVKAVSKSLTLSTGRVYELVRMGILPAVHFGERQIRISEQALRAFIADGGKVHRVEQIESTEPTVASDLQTDRESRAGPRASDV